MASRRGAVVGRAARCARCDGRPFAGGRISHMREAHPAAWRALLAQLVLPWLYLGAVAGLLRARAPLWAFPVVVLAALAVSLRLRVKLKGGGTARAGARLAGLLVFIGGAAAAIGLAVLASRS